jgi:hypothetical protein
MCDVSERQSTATSAKRTSWVQPGCQAVRTLLASLHGGSNAYDGLSLLKTHAYNYMFRALGSRTDPPPWQSHKL